jgi:hypothetical protein
MATINRLRNVKLNEISFVGKGDNPEAHVLLLKIKADPKGASIVALGKEYKGGKQDDVLKKWLTDNATLVSKDDGDAVTFADIQADKDLRDKVWQMCYTLEDSLSSIVHDDTVTDKTAMISQSIDQFKAAITAITKGEEDMPLVKMTKERDEALEKNVTLTKTVTDLTTEVETLKAMSAEDKKKMKDMEDAKDGGADDTEEGPDGKKIKKSDIMKSLPESIQKEMKENREAIAKMQDNERTREYVGKAASCLLVGPADSVGDLLKTIAKHDPATADKVLELFKTANERIKEGDLLKETGKDAGDTGATAHDKIMAKAQVLKKTRPELSIEKAYTEVFDTDTDLRKQYEDERKAA